MNYVITKLLDGIICKNGMSYGVIAALVGELACVQMELYRRLGAPYEDLKKDKNGDVFSTNIPAE